MGYFEGGELDVAKYCSNGRSTTCGDKKWSNSTTPAISFAEHTLPRGYSTTILYSIKHRSTPFRSVPLPESVITVRRWTHVVEHRFYRALKEPEGWVGATVRWITSHEMTMSCYHKRQWQALRVKYSNFHSLSTGYVE